MAIFLSKNTFLLGKKLVKSTLIHLRGMEKFYRVAALGFWPWWPF